MSLKHLLNDTDPEIYPNHTPLLGWDELGIQNEPIFSLPSQSWDQYIGELFGTQGPEDNFHHTFNVEDLGPMPETWDSTQSEVQIEQWGTEHTSSLQEVTEEPLIEEDYTCYGMLYRTSVKLCGNMAELDTKLSMGGASPIQGHLQMNLVNLGSDFQVTFSDGVVLGELNMQLETALARITEQGFQLQYEVFANIKAIRETISKVTKEKNAIVRVQINVYGPPSVAGRVGRELSRGKIYLQYPDHIRPGTSYDNPHVLKLDSFRATEPTSEQHVSYQSIEAESARDLKQVVADVYSSLTRSQNLEGLEGDERLRTPLLLHQKKALDFMMQRENGPIPEKYRLWKPHEREGLPCYLHAVAGTISRFEQEETGGGILADEMGMGKSLSILALILRTLEAAHMWATGTEQDLLGSTETWSIGSRSRATLIVASSDLMINEWFQELEKHFSSETRNSLETIKYHGQNRRDLQNRFRDAGIVISTYHTLASDFSNSKNSLDDIEWYRLVLDEAHIIRRQSTTLYRTVADIKAKSRWCLTGTPIQNRLEDIGSLLAFLKIAPFHNISVFRNSIALPFDEGRMRRKLAIERFTKLLDALCLRRTTDLLDLPEQQNRVRSIQLSSRERAQYDQTKEIMFRAICNQAGDFGDQSTLGMFQVRLQLRILCNHGTWQQMFSWHRRKLHLLDEREAMEASFGRDGEATCSLCKQTMPLFGTGSSFRRYTENCRHVLCSECLEQSMTADQDRLPTSCPLCSSLWNPATQAHRNKQTSQEDTYFRSQGESSKMNALVEDVLENVWKTKSIVFTCWTRTLDLIQIYLHRESLTKHNVQRIDGDCSTAKRERILEDFAADPNLRILIMTTGTGAVGLNLAVANRVFIVEPQWNPSVENQAVARALRLGQKHPVLVTRYIVENSVEQDMRKLQDKKLERANLVNSG